MKTPESHTNPSDIARKELDEAYKNVKSSNETISSRLSSSILELKEAVDNAEKHKVDVSSIKAELSSLCEESWKRPITKTMLWLREHVHELDTHPTYMTVRSINSSAWLIMNDVEEAIKSFIEVDIVLPDTFKEVLKTSMQECYDVISRNEFNEDEKMRFARDKFTYLMRRLSTGDLPGLKQ